MTTLLPQLSAPVPNLQLTGPTTVQIRFASPLPPSLQNLPPQPAAPIPNQPASGLTLTVLTTQPGGPTTLQLPNGEVLLATLQPPPSPGSQLTIPPAQLKLLANTAAPTPATPNTPTPPSSAELPILTARLTTPPSPQTQPATLPASTAPLSATISPTPSQPTPPSLLPNLSSPLTPRAEVTQNRHQAAPGAAKSAPNTPSAPSFSPPAPPLSSSKQLINAIKYLNSSNIFADTQQPLPPGPVSLNLQQKPPLNTPLTLTLSTPTRGTLTQPNTPPQPITLATPTPLPTRTSIPLIFIENSASPQQPLALLTQPIPSPATTPFTPPALSALHLLLNPSPTPIPTNTPLTARVLSNQPVVQQGFSGQPILLATGHTAVIQSPQPIPEGSVMVVEFPTLAGVGQVLHVQPSGQQTPQQQQPAPPATSTPTPATPSPALPAGITVQGTVSLSPQGQPILTLAQPAAYAGQSIPLHLPENLHTQIPPGTHLTLRIEANNTPPTVLEITMPPAAERAQTLTTLTTRWESLQQGLNLLSTQAPSLAQSLQANLPQLAALLPGLITFTEALRRKDADLIFGKQTTATLRAMGVDLSSDIQHLAQLQQPQPDTSWRGTLFPYVEAPGQDPRQGGFFWRREKRDDPRAPTNTRFVMNLELSNLGPLQLDGLINYPNLWLKLRRTTPLEGNFTEELQKLVNNTLEAYGLTGGIVVEVTSTFPVDPLAEMLAETPSPLPTSA